MIPACGVDLQNASEYTSVLFYTQTDRETERKRERLKNLLWFVGVFLTT